MPVVIQPEDFSRWLDCRNHEPRDVLDLLQTPEQGLFEAIPVSDKVNKVANIGPDLQDRVEPAAVAKAVEKQKSGDAGQLMLF